MAESIPTGWLSAIARVAGADDIANLLAATAALLEVAVPNDLVVLSCQYNALAFAGGVPANEAQIGHPVMSLTAQAVVSPPPERPMPLVLTDMPSMGAFVAKSGLRHGLAASIAYRGNFGMTLMAYRKAQRGAFDDEAVRAVATVKPILVKALERLLDQQRNSAFNKGLLGFINDLPIGLIMLDWDYKTLFANREGRRQSRHWPSASQVASHARDDFELPYAVSVACIEFHERFLRETSAGAVDDATPPFIVQHPSEPALYISVTASRSLENPHEPFKYLVRFHGLATRVEKYFDPSPDQLELLAQLTAAERTVALLVRQGLSNREISERLHREVSTVKDHLTHIFDKLAIKSRVQLARLLS